MTAVLAGQNKKLLLDLAPDGRAWIDNFKVSDVFHGDEFHVFAGFLFQFRVVLAEFVRNVFIGRAVDKDLFCSDVSFSGRSLAVVVGHFCWRAAEKTCDGIIAQVQLPAATQIKHAGQREHPGDRRLMCSKTQGKLPAGGMSGNAEAVAIETREFILAAEKEAQSGANVLKRSRPPAVIAHAAVLNVAGGETCLLECVT